MFNSPADPLATVLRQDAPQPALAVFTGAVQPGARGREIIGTTAGMTVRVVVQSFVPPAGRVAMPGAQAGALLTIGNGGESLILDIIGRQIVAVLHGVSPGPWLRLWQGLVVGYDEVSAAPVSFELGEGGGALSVPGQELTIACRTIPDPAFGVALPPFWADLDATLRGTPECVTIADALRSLIEDPSGISEWRKLTAMLALSDSAAVAGGFGPLDPTAAADGSEPAVLANMETDPADLVVGEVEP